MIERGSLTAENEKLANELYSKIEAKIKSQLFFDIVFRENLKYPAIKPKKSPGISTEIDEGAAADVEFVEIVGFGSPDTTIHRLRRADLNNNEIKTKFEEIGRGGYGTVFDGSFKHFFAAIKISKDDFKTLQKEQKVVKKALKRGSTFPYTIYKILEVNEYDENRQAIGKVSVIISELGGETFKNFMINSKNAKKILDDLKIIEKEHEILNKNMVIHLDPSLSNIIHRLDKTENQSEWMLIDFSQSVAYRNDEILRWTESKKGSLFDERTLNFEKFNVTAMYIRTIIVTKNYNESESFMLSTDLYEYMKNTAEKNVEEIIDNGMIDIFIMSKDQGDGYLYNKDAIYTGPANALFVLDLYGEEKLKKFLVHVDEENINRSVNGKQIPLYIPLTTRANERGVKKGVDTIYILRNSCFLNGVFEVEMGLTTDKKNYFKKIGSGSYGDVYEAKVIHNGSDAVLKVMLTLDGNQKEVARNDLKMQKEFYKASPGFVVRQISSGICRTYILKEDKYVDAGNDVYYSLMERGSGTFCDVIKNYTGDDIQNYYKKHLVEILDGYDSLNAKGFFHLDSTCRNVVQVNGTFKIIDFGLSTSMTDIENTLDYRYNKINNLGAVDSIYFLLYEFFARYVVPEYKNPKLCNVIVDLFMERKIEENIQRNEIFIEKHNKYPKYFKKSLTAIKNIVGSRSLPIILTQDSNTKKIPSYITLTTTDFQKNPPGEITYILEKSCFLNSVFEVEILPNTEKEYFKKIGSGGYGDVYEAKVIHDGTDAVLKVMLTLYQNQIDVAKNDLKMQKEFYKASPGFVVRQISSGFCRTYNFKEDKYVDAGKDVYYSLMERGSGTFCDVIKNYAENDIAKYYKKHLDEICAGYDSLNMKGFFHKDPTCSNLVLVGETFKIIDFGLSRSTIKPKYFEIVDSIYFLQYEYYIRSTTDYKNDKLLDIISKKFNTYPQSSTQKVTDVKEQFEPSRVQQKSTSKSGAGGALQEGERVVSLIKNIHRNKCWIDSALTLIFNFDTGLTLRDNVEVTGYSNEITISDQSNEKNSNRILVEIFRENGPKLIEIGEIVQNTKTYITTKQETDKLKNVFNLGWTYQIMEDILGRDIKTSIFKLRDGEFEKCKNTQLNSIQDVKDIIKKCSYNQLNNNFDGPNLLKVVDNEKIYKSDGYNDPADFLQRVLEPTIQKNYYIGNNFKRNEIKQPCTFFGGNFSFNIKNFELKYNRPGAKSNGEYYIFESIEEKNGIIPDILVTFNKSQKREKGYFILQVDESSFKIQSKDILKINLNYEGQKYYLQSFINYIGTVHYTCLFKNKKHWYVANDLSDSIRGAIPSDVNDPVILRFVHESFYRNS